jgi:uncharacterized protein YdeI (YjbR/CyaY-like superfamily)
VVFGTSGRVPVLVDFDGQPYRGSMVRMDTICHILPVLKAIREKIHKNIGDTVQVVLELDDQPRIIEPPQDLIKAFQQNPVAGERFKHLSYTHQREYVQWIEEAKRQPTRERRINETIRILLES